MKENINVVCFIRTKIAVLFINPEIINVKIDD